MSNVELNSEDAHSEPKDIEAPQIQAEDEKKGNVTTPASLTAATNQYSPPPNGGFMAWLQVFGAWCIWFACW
jgi:hypothetical protein